MNVYSSTGMNIEKKNIDSSRNYTKPPLEEFQYLLNAHIIWMKHTYMHPKF